MEKIDTAQIDCEGTQTGYRCWAAGETGFIDAVKSATKAGIAESAEKLVRSAVRDEIKHLIDLETKTHAKHHEYIQSQIERNDRDRERWEKIKTQVLGWGIIAIVGWIGALSLKALEHWKGHP